MGKAAPAPLSASLLGVPKGAATPPADAAPAVADPVAEAAPPAPGSRRQLLTVPPPLEEPKSALTVRLPLSTLERLREAAHRTRKEKQIIVDEALNSWLDGNDF